MLDVDYSQADWGVGGEILLHHMIDPSCPANSIVYLKVVGQVEVVSLCQDAGWAGFRHFEAAAEESTSYAAEREETWAAEEGHTVLVHSPPEEFFGSVDTLAVRLHEWQADKRYLTERMLEQVRDLKLSTLLLVLKASSRSSMWDTENQYHTEGSADPKNC